MFGGNGRVLLFSHASGVTTSKRFFSRPKSLLPSKAPEHKGDGASGALLHDGMLAILSGSSHAATTQADFRNIAIVE
jgi:hypothetical protein